MFLRILQRNPSPRRNESNGRSTVRSNAIVEFSQVLAKSPEGRHSTCHGCVSGGEVGGGGWIEKTFLSLATFMASWVIFIKQ